ncbi:MAG: SIR2 family protein [Methylococcus sp.]
MFSIGKRGIYFSNDFLTRSKEPTSLVLTRSQYRHRLYSDPAYLTVLRSLLATSTVLFLGYSLTDAYLNELRSELVEAFSSNDGTADPIAWAVIEGVSEVAIQYYKKHEGLGVVPYQAHDGDHGEFDTILKAIFDETNPVHRLGTLLNGRRILWFDPHPPHNDLVRTLFQTALKECAGQSYDADHHLVEATSMETAWSHLENSDIFDLVISHWGHGLYEGRPNGVELLRHLSKRRAEANHVPPALIFASGDHEEENRRQALSLGAAEFVSRWEDLIEVTERLLKPTYAG